MCRVTPLPFNWMILLVDRGCRKWQKTILTISYLIQFYCISFPFQWNHEISRYTCENWRWCVKRISTGRRCDWCAMSAIQIHNFTSGDTVSYSLPLLVGEVRPPLAQGSITVTRCSSPPGSNLPLLDSNAPCLDDASSWPVYNGRFKALVLLVPGENRVALRYLDEVAVIVLVYCVPDFVNFVRPVYIRCSDDAGTFQGPDEEDRSLDSAVRRIILATRLLQTFTAEKMNEHGFGRRTFVLEHDLDPTRPPCHVFTSRLKMKAALAMNGSDLWMNFARELMSSRQFRDKDNCKWFAFMSFTRYAPPTNQSPKSHSDVLRFTQGHAALGEIILLIILIMCCPLTLDITMR